MRWVSGIILAVVLLAGLGRAQESTPAAEAPLPSSQLKEKRVSPPAPLNNVEAEFSVEARQKHINGLCLVTLIVDAGGMPQNIKLVRCTDPAFAENSLAAVAKYRFRPATTQEGKPVPVVITVEINYQLEGGRNATTPVRFRFNSPPGITSATPDANGVYPLTKLMTAPEMTWFSDVGYGAVAFRIVGSAGCDVVLTISEKGKALDPELKSCEKPELVKPVVASLLKSHYKPGRLNGKAVPVRALIRLEYGAEAVALPSK